MEVQLGGSHALATCHSPPGQELVGSWRFGGFASTLCVIEGLAFCVSYGDNRMITTRFQILESNSGGDGKLGGK